MSDWNPLQVGQMGILSAQAQSINAGTHYQQQARDPHTHCMILTKAMITARDKMKAAATGYKDAQGRIERSCEKTNALHLEREQELQKPREQIDFAKVGQLTRDMILVERDNTDGYLSRGRARQDFEIAEGELIEALRASGQIPKLE